MNINSKMSLGVLIPIITLYKFIEIKECLFWEKKMFMG